MQGEVRRHAVELGEAAFGEAPEALDAVYMDAVLGKVLRLVDPEVAVVADIDEAVVTRPAVGDEDGVQRDVAPDNCP
jgi:hypothetical protein